MTTGYKLNHASDNAANYSIAQNMVSKLSSYDVATSNISMGSDLLKTAQDSISLMQSHGERIHNLVTQAMNGTYGEESQKAIVSEINARIAEVDRLYQTTEYNGIQLFNNQKVEIPEDSTLKPGDGGFLDESALSGPVMVEETGFIRALSSGTVDGIKDSYTDVEIAEMTKVKTLTKFTANQTYAVVDKEDLLKLAELQNSGKSTANVTFVLGADLDLSEIENWNPIGDHKKSTASFKGTFNGNGHTISNLKVDNPDTSCQGLFGHVNGGKIRNLGLKDAEVSGNLYCGALVGWCQTNSSKIDNCWATSTVSGQGSYVGGLIGFVSSKQYNVIKNCYSISDVSGERYYVGGLVGSFYNGSVENCFSKSSVYAKLGTTGGLIGSVIDSTVSNSYSYSDIAAKGGSSAGGFIGSCYGTSTVNSCYSKGSVVGRRMVGGFIGNAGASATADASVSISNSASYCTNIIGNEAVGSFIGNYRTQTYYSEDYKSSHGDKFIYTGTLTLDNCQSMNLEGLDMLRAYIVQYTDEGYEDPETGEWVSARKANLVPDESCDISPLLANIQGIDITSKSTSVQVGINGGSSDSITFDSNFMYNLSAITAGGKVNKNSYLIINDFLDKLSSKATALGAVTNRLDSALESTTVAMENLTSSLSTIRDADIATESSNYIKAQILQQASATLLATANQSPSIALQLL